MLSQKGGSLKGGRRKSGGGSAPSPVDSGIVTSSSGNGKDVAQVSHQKRKRKMRRGKPKRRRHGRMPDAAFLKSKTEKRNGEVKSVDSICKLTLVTENQRAPINTTQFIMQEHELGHMESDHRVKPNSDSDDDNSTQCDDYQIREFDDTYYNECVKRLSSLSKRELVHQYLLLEGTGDRLERELIQRRSDDDDDVGRGEVKMEPETAEKVRIFQNEIVLLTNENKRLKDGIDRMRGLTSTLSPAKSTSSVSVDSESDSPDSSSSSSSCSSSCCEEDVADIAEVVLNGYAEHGESPSCTSQPESSPVLNSNRDGTLTSQFL